MYTQMHTWPLVVGLLAGWESWLLASLFSTFKIKETIFVHILVRLQQGERGLP